MRSASPSLVVPVLLLLAVSGLSGCTSSSSWVSMSVQSDRADEVEDLMTRQVDHEIAIEEGEPVRIRNLAGHIEFRHADVDAVLVEATIHAHTSSEDRTRAIIDEMTWIRGRDQDGHGEWTLDYPITHNSRFHYSWADRGFRIESRAFGPKVTVTTRKETTTTTLFADLIITCPRGTNLSVRTIAGDVSGGSMTGDFAIDVGVGQIDLTEMTGTLHADGSSGTITVGRMEGYAHLDTGSGDINIGWLDGSTHADAGSGSITIDSGDAESVHADTGSGDIVINGGRVATVHADTGSGDVIMTDVAIDRLDADTGSGDVLLKNVAILDLHADTGSGDVTIHGPLADTRQVYADTGSGDVEIVASHEADFVIRADVGGRLTVGYDDATFISSHGDETNIKRGEGRTRIRIDTNSGNLTVRPNEEAS